MSEFIVNLRQFIHDTVIQLIHNCDLPWVHLLLQHTPEKVVMETDIL